MILLRYSISCLVHMPLCRLLYRNGTFTSKLTSGNRCTRLMLLQYFKLNLPILLHLFLRFICLQSLHTTTDPINTLKHVEGLLCNKTRSIINNKWKYKRRSKINHERTSCDNVYTNYKDNSRFIYNRTASTSKHGELLVGYMFDITLRIEYGGYSNV